MKQLSDLSFDFNKLKHVFFDFDGVFTDNSVYVDAFGNELIKSSRAEGFGLRILKECGVTFSIVSSEVHPVAAARAKKLDVPISLAVKDKPKFINDWCKFRGEELSSVAFVGNDLNDVEAMIMSGISFCPSDAWPASISVADYKTSRCGGDGAVREICEYIALKRSHHDRV